MAEAVPSAHGPILWLGGWASGLACWRRDLERLYPGRKHHFLDAHDLLDAPSLLAGSAAGLSGGGAIIAWSLGSLLLHKALEAGSFPISCRLVSVSPIYDFCAEGGPWPRASVRRMTRRLAREPDAVLAEFWALVKGGSPVSEDQERAWHAQARRYSSETLARGLEFLAANALEMPPGGGSRHAAGHFHLASFRDPLAPPQGGAFPSDYWRPYDRGHLPFLDYPESLSPLLPGARGPG